MDLVESQESREKREKLIRQLRYFSRDPRQRLIGILLDVGVGGTGLYLDVATKKADEILKEFALFTL